MLDANTIEKPHGADVDAPCTDCQNAGCSKVKAQSAEAPFSYVEVDANFDIERIADLIQFGHTEGHILYVIRNALDPKVCATITESFHNLIASKGSKRGEDGFVKVEQIGSSQFHKDGESYIRSTLDQAQDVLDLFSCAGNDVLSDLFLDDSLEDFYRKRRITYRASKHLTSTGNFATTRRWLNNGQMSLMPHEDTAQLMFAAQDGYEVHEGQNTIAVNHCFAQDEEGSELMVWNIKPDLAMRQGLGVETTGYPYPLDVLAPYESVSVKLNAGDMYFLNASYVHGVSNSKGNSRISSGRFLTKVGDKVVYWT